jgi:aldehyde:ferredoxin oxidoreductase
MSKSKDVALPDEVTGYTQIRLDVDLTDGTVKESTMSKEFCRDWIGGYGFTMLQIATRPELAPKSYGTN